MYVMNEELAQLTYPRVSRWTLLRSRSVSEEICPDSWQPVTCKPAASDGLAQEGAACLGDVRKHFRGRDLLVGPRQRLQGVAPQVTRRLQPDQAEQDVQAGPPRLEGCTPTCAATGSPCNTTEQLTMRQPGCGGPRIRPLGGFDHTAKDHRSLTALQIH